MIPYSEISTNPGFPAPGIYKNMPDHVYHVMPYVSQSRLSRLYQSPKHCRYAIDHDEEGTTAALRVGSALHDRVLRPGYFDAKYRVFSGYRRTKDQKESYNAMVDLVGEDYILKNQERVAIEHMHEAIQQHERCKKLLDSLETVETVVIWDDEETGVRCKAKVDGIAEKLGIVLDIKTTTNANAFVFQKSMAQYGYHRQGAFYIQGLQHFGLNVNHYAIICVEKTPPYGVILYRLDERTIEFGKSQIKDLLRLYQHHEKQDFWPGYATEIVDISLPEYAFAKKFLIEEEI